MNARLDRKLALVIPVYDDASELNEDEPVRGYVHSTPISRAQFNVSYMLMAKTFAAIHSEGLGVLAGPRIAKHLLFDVGSRMVAEGAVNPAEALMREIERLTNFLTPGANGWEMVPYEDAVKRKLLSEEEQEGIGNAIVYFIVISAMHPRPIAEATMDAAARLWSARVEFLSCTDFLASLPKSTPATPSPTTTVSSIPH